MWLPILIWTSWEIRRAKGESKKSPSGCSIWSEGVYCEVETTREFCLCTRVINARVQFLKLSLLHWRQRFISNSGTLWYVPNLWQWSASQKLCWYGHYGSTNCPCSWASSRHSDTSSSPTRSAVNRPKPWQSTSPRATNTPTPKQYDPQTGTWT